MSMKVIEHIEVGSGGATDITFSLIPQTYDDLYVVFSARSSRAATDDGAYIKFNGSTAGFSFRRLYAVPSVGTTSGSYGILGLMPGSTLTANTFGSISFVVPNYKSAVAKKSYSSDAVTENNGTTFFADIIAGLWSVTDPITSLTLYAPTGNLVEFSSATLYGISAGSDGSTAVS